MASPASSSIPLRCTAPSADLAAESIPLSRQPVDVGVLIELTTEVMQIQAATLGVVLTIHIDDDVPDTVSVDRDKVGWAIASLIGSALRHVHGPGGLIALHVSYDIAAATLRFSVRDNGPGISPERLKRLLEREHWHPGSALALLLVQDIAVAHGGSMTVDSRTDREHHFTDIAFTTPTRAC